MHRFALLTAAALISGCATDRAALPVERRVVVPGAEFAAVRGEADLVVRTFVEDAAGARAEVGGATCGVTSSLYRATLTTPARLVVPNFGPQSPELLLDCRAGELRGTATRDISTTWRYAPGYPVGYPYRYGPYAWPGYQGGFGGPLGWYDRPAYPRSDYRNVSVLLR